MGHTMRSCTALRTRAEDVRAESSSRIFHRSREERPASRMFLGRYPIKCSSIPVRSRVCQSLRPSVLSGVLQTFSIRSQVQSLMVAIGFGLSNEAVGKPHSGEIRFRFSVERKIDLVQNWGFPTASTLGWNGGCLLSSRHAKRRPFKPMLGGFILTCRPL